jgi:hypothetical protein
MVALVLICGNMSNDAEFLLMHFLCRADDGVCLTAYYSGGVRGSFGRGQLVIHVDVSTDDVGTIVSVVVVHGEE